MNMNATPIRLSITILCNGNNGIQEQWGTVISRGRRQLGCERDARQPERSRNMEGVVLYRNNSCVGIDFPLTTDEEEHRRAREIRLMVDHGGKTAISVER